MNLPLLLVNLVFFATGGYLFSQSGMHAMLFGWA